MPDVPYAFTNVWGNYRWLTNTCRVCKKKFFNARTYRTAPRTGYRVVITGKKSSSFCSDACLTKWRKRKRAEQRKEEAATRAEARSGRVCEQCGEPIEAARSTKRYCSIKCRVAAHRATFQAGSGAKHDRAATKQRHFRKSRSGTAGG